MVEIPTKLLKFKLLLPFERQPSSGRLIHTFSTGLVQVLFMLPPVPGPPIYLFGGLVISKHCPYGFWRLGQFFFVCRFGAWEQGFPQKVSICHFWEVNGEIEQGFALHSSINFPKVADGNFMNSDLIKGMFPVSWPSGITVAIPAWFGPVQGDSGSLPWPMAPLVVLKETNSKANLDAAKTCLSKESFINRDLVRYKSPVDLFVVREIQVVSSALFRC